ncbi:hypothetical protein DCS_06149 [Drechmeria coniospora]|uniref:Uncharacterized protein n=1 Tax=Drechmeria coniospora TaxID=98403 RepID=A0A151GAS8_DRECN|nr:hypothetical protein DCS_06149 [Drechmeria coniospora]KYK54192.1 hypothetical protein DCS_06149 [Drechmeria coniospora]ODA77505.1 hypothetical protein RJ55_07134 [Drechmeria coniospora]
MASKAVIPRFLLPLQGPLWRGVRIPLSQNIRIRFASTDKVQKPMVLEKPAKFNPPSHGSRLKKQSMPKHYGPDLTAAELAAQHKRDYPGLMAPQGSWSHWFWHSRLLHTFITMGTLLAMGIYTFFMNYAYNSPFKDLVPPFSDLWHQPAYFFTQWKNVILMHEKDKGLKAVEQRTRHVDDVAKRRYYMKMHGIEARDPISMVFGKDEGKKVVDGGPAAEGGEQRSEVESEEKPGQRKKWFGIL